MPPKSKDKKKQCGIIMPISNFNNRTEEYWQRIRSFIEKAIQETGMDPVAAWEDDKTDIIHAKIIRNIESLPIMIGVIAGYNPNVMLECGMRLWTNKPILLIAGQGESIPFDVGSIQCLMMSNECDYFEMVRLKDEIVEKLKWMNSDKYKTFKSYYDMPATVDAPSKNDKIVFDEFVKEVRMSLSALRTDVANQKIMLDKINSSAKLNISSDSTPMLGPTGSPCNNYVVS